MAEAMDEGAVGRAVELTRSKLNEELEIATEELIDELIIEFGCSFEHARNLIFEALRIGSLRLTPHYTVTLPAEPVAPVVPRVAASWDETFMRMALVVANRSKDPSTQVGACIVSEDNRILSLGYNGTPNGWADEDFPWAKVAESQLDTKYPYVIHAERNAVLNYGGIHSQLRGAKIFVTHFPCNECAKELAQVGVAEVIYLHSHDSSDFSTQASLRILEACGVALRKLELN